MTRILILLAISSLLMGCMKTTCVSPHKCEKTVDWKDPKFTLFRTIITNGANAGK
jgi:hypothetical protein